jgi:ribosomal protein S21
MFVMVHPGEPFEAMLTRFRRGVEASGLLREYRRHQRFTPAHEFRLQKIRAAQRKRRRAAERGR